MADDYKTNTKTGNELKEERDIPKDAAAPTDGETGSGECSTPTDSCCCGGGTCDCTQREDPSDEDPHATKEPEQGTNEEKRAGSLNEFINELGKKLFGDDFPGGRVVIGVGRPIAFGERCEKADDCPRASTCPMGDQASLTDDIDPSHPLYKTLSELDERMRIVDTQQRHILQRLNQLIEMQPKQFEGTTLKAHTATMKVELTGKDRKWLLETMKKERKKGVKELRKAIKEKFAGLTMSKLFADVIPNAVHRTLDELDIDYDF